MKYLIFINLTYYSLMLLALQPYKHQSHCHHNQGRSCRRTKPKLTKKHMKNCQEPTVTVLEYEINLSHMLLGKNVSSQFTYFNDG